MKRIIAKFKCSQVTQQAGAPQQELVKLAPVFAESGPNKEWNIHTPSGQLEMTINNAAAQGFIKAGTEYKITVEEWSDE